MQNWERALVLACSKHVCGLLHNTTARVGAVYPSAYLAPVVCLRTRLLGLVRDIQTTVSSLLHMQPLQSC